MGLPWMKLPWLSDLGSFGDRLVVRSLSSGVHPSLPLSLFLNEDHEISCVIGSKTMSLLQLFKTYP